VRLAGCILRFDPVFGAADQEDQKEIDDAGICFHGKLIMMNNSVEVNVKASKKSSHEQIFYTIGTGCVISDHFYPGE